MESKSKTGWMYSPIFQVTFTWLWFFIGAALTVAVLLWINGVGFSEAQVVLGQQRHLTAYIEVVSVGLAPVVFAWLNRDNLKELGYQKAGLGRSMLYSLLFVAFMYGVGYLRTGQIMSDSRTPLEVAAPWHIFYGLLGIFAWGPLEVFFFNWLVDKTDQIFKSRAKLFSWGLVVTVVLFALSHVVTTDWFNAAYTGFIFLILGLIYKRTRNAYGPMLAWTLINGQVWYLAALLF